MPTNLGSSRDTAPLEKGYSPEQVQAMQRAVIQLFARWGVSDLQAAVLIGGISTKALQRWTSGQYGNPTRDQADRMSLLLGIHKALRIIYRDAARGYRWIKAPNDIFDGQSALDVMLRGDIDDIRQIRTYLDSVQDGC